MFEGQISSIMRKTLIILLIIFGSCATAQNMLSPEFLWKLGRVNEYEVSPDGKWLIYVVKKYDLAANSGKNYVYRMALPAGVPEQISSEQQNAFALKFIKGGTRISYLSAESGEVQLWEMSLDGNEKNRMTEIPGGINGYLFSPDGTKLVYAADVKTRKNTQDIYPDLPKTSGRVIDALMYRHWDSWEDENSSHLFVADLQPGQMLKAGKDMLEGEPFDAPTQPFGGMEEVCWSPDGKWIAYTCKKLQGTAEAQSTNTDIFLYELATAQTKNITESNEGYDKQPLFSPDGTRIAWLSMKTPGYESDKNRIMIMNFSGTNAADITNGFVHSVETYAWADPSTLYFTATVAATQQVFVYGKKPGMYVQVTQGDHDYISAVPFKMGKKVMLMGSKMSISMPAELFMIDPVSGQETQVTQVNKAMLASVKMGKVEKRMIKASDGKDILTWVIYPPDFNPNNKYPTLLYCQGGPQSPVSQFFSYRWNFQLMAANGYIVVAPNRRGLPGFGAEWNDAIAGDYGGQCMRDYLSAIDAVAKEPFVDPRRLGAVGASFGGFSVYWLAGNHEKRFQCFIAHCGMFNMESWYGSTEELFFANHDNKGSYWTSPRPANYYSSPHRFVKSWDTPILVIHNEKDYRVPVTQGMEAFTAAQAQGVPSRFLYFPDENHWVVKPQNSVLWQRVFFEWLDKWLKK